MDATLHNASLHMLDVVTLDRSIAHRGESSQVAQLYAKLESGKPIALGVIGASVAQNAGCLDQPKRRCMRFNGRAIVPLAHGKPRKRPFKGFAVRFLDHVNASWPHLRHRINNSGIDKTPVSGMLTCLMTNLPTDLDIVLVEFNSMARWTTLPGVEGLVRILASLRPQPPAIVVVSVNNWCPGKGEFVRKVEDESERVCRHYGVACLSQRRALEPWVQAGAITKEQLVGKDCVHPINGPLGVDSISAIVQHWFDQMRPSRRIGGSNLDGVRSSGASRGALPTPLWSENADTNTSQRTRGQQCFAFGTPDQKWLVRFTQQLAPLFWRTTWCAPTERPWLAWRLTSHIANSCRAAPFEHNTTAQGVPTAQEFVEDIAVRSLTCPEKVVRAGGLAYAAFLAHPPRGFFYCNMELKANDQGTSMESFGVLAIVPGATLHFEPRDTPAPFMATLAYLTSYQGMGIAALNCVGSCECGEQLVDAHDSESNATIFATLELTVSTRLLSNGQHEADKLRSEPCGLQLQVLARTSSGGHKFKVRHLMLAKGKALGLLRWSKVGY